MRKLLLLSLLMLEVTFICAFATESHMNKLVAETLAMLSKHRTLLIGNGTLRIPTPEHKNHQLCIEEVFQGIETLKNQTAPDEAVEKLFQNLSSIKEHIDDKKKKCGSERWGVRHFLDYLQEFLGVINTEWTMDN